eukprot:6908859-Alexandrium_andersonii.AAC.1
MPEEGARVRQEAGACDELPAGEDQARGRGGRTAARRPGKRAAAGLSGAPAAAAARHREPDGGGAGFEGRL